MWKKSLSFCRGFFLLLKNIVNFVDAIVFKMGNESQIVIGQLKNHIEQIISKYELALSENIALKQQLQKTQEELELKNGRISELEQAVEQIQLADAFNATSEDVKQAKRRIASIVKEIDRCISMLND